jgi:hypothetical protein
MFQHLTSFRTELHTFEGERLQQRNMYLFFNTLLKRLIYIKHEKNLSQEWKKLKTMAISQENRAYHDRISN